MSAQPNKTPLIKVEIITFYNQWYPSISYKFGVIAMISGVIGVPLGSYLAQRLRHTNPACDPQICAWGLFVSAPMIYLALISASKNLSLSFVFVFFAMVSLNLGWSIVADMLLVRDRTNRETKWRQQWIHGKSHGMNMNVAFDINYLSRKRMWSMENCNDQGMHKQTGNFQASRIHELHWIQHSTICFYGIDNHRMLGIS